MSQLLQNSCYSQQQENHETIPPSSGAFLSPYWHCKGERAGCERQHSGKRQPDSNVLMSVPHPIPFPCTSYILVKSRGWYQPNLFLPKLFPLRLQCQTYESSLRLWPCSCSLSPAPDSREFKKDLLSICLFWKARSLPSHKLKTVS